MGCLQTNWTTWSASIRIATSTRLRLSTRGRARWSRRRRRRLAGAATRRRCGWRHRHARGARVGCRGHRPLRCRPCALAAAQRRAGTRSRVHKPRRAAAARQGRSARRSPCRPLRTGNHAPRDAAGRASTRRRCGCSCSPDGGAVDTRRVALVQLRSVIVTAPDEASATSYGDCRSVSCSKRCSRFRRSSSRAPDELATILVLRTLARRIQAATAEAETLEREILTHIRALVPQLLDEPGVGPIVAAQLIVTWSHHDRVVSEAAFARRWRRTRPGLERPDHAIPTSRGGRPPTQPRSPHHRPPPPSTRPRTRDYIARLVAEGKSTRDAVRLLKRYLARHLYRVMQNSAPRSPTVIGASFPDAGPSQRHSAESVTAWSSSRSYSSKKFAYSWRSYSSAVKGLFGAP